MVDSAFLASLANITLIPEFSRVSRKIVCRSFIPSMMRTAVNWSLQAKSKRKIYPINVTKVLPGAKYEEEMGERMTGWYGPTNRRVHVNVT